jgi:hypothetical protein
MLKTVSSAGGGGGGISQIVAGVGLNGGTITASGTISVFAGFGLSAQSGALQTTVNIPIPGNGTPPTL